MILKIDNVMMFVNDNDTDGKKMVILISLVTVVIMMVLFMQYKMRMVWGI